jgi:acetyl esterase/lipase
MMFGWQRSNCAIGVACLVLSLLPPAVRSPARQPQVILLWPEGVPGAIANGGPEVSADGRVSNVHQPTLTLYSAAVKPGTATAVIVCPGGGYQRLSIEKEGQAVAAWLNSLGVSAFVLKYRLKEYGHPAPLRDVLRAVRIVRRDAAGWRIDPGRIGVLGFSAGGHLAATAGTLFDAAEGRTGADIDRVRARPDFMILVYPVITFQAPYAHAGSRENLLGKSPSNALVERLSADLQVTGSTPPAFLVHGGTDQSVPPENSVLFYMALRRAGVPAELHVYERGPHGFGLAPDQGPISDWTKRAAEWMTVRGFLPPV